MVLNKIIHYILNFNVAEHCPRLMRGLLDTKELSDIFGEVPVYIVTIIVMIFNFLFIFRCCV